MTTGRARWVPEVVPDVLTELRSRNRVLYAVALANLALAVVFTALMQLDARTLLGRNVWTKPWKFATSIAIFTATMGWILPSLSLSERVERLVTYTIGGAMTVEIVLIAMQAARGVASHFNNSTPFDSTVFAVMGVTITFSSLAVVYVLWRVVRDPPDLPTAYLWAVGLGMLLFVVTSFEGWLMVAQDGHAVDAPNDSPGLPLLNWSVTGGDLRVAHFVGLHALQVLPLTGYYATRWEGGTTRRSLGIVALVGAVYTLFTGLTFVQAMLGTPFVSSVPGQWVPVSVAAAVLLCLSVCGAAVLGAMWTERPAA
jgi:hypothetical protein